MKTIFTHKLDIKKVIVYIIIILFHLPSIVLSQDCSKSSAAYNNKYGRINYYRDNFDKTPVKTILINFVIFQTDLGENNFKDISLTDPDNDKTKIFFDDVMILINNFYSNNIQTAYPEIIGVTSLTNTKIQFKLNAMIFPHSSAMNDATVGDLMTSFLNNDLTYKDKLNQLNIFFTEGLPIISGASGYASRIDILNQFIVTYSKWSSNGGDPVQTDSEYGNRVNALAIHLGHELAHCISLSHVYVDGNSSPETCNESDPEYLSDVYVSGLNLDCPLIGGWETANTNNMMGGHKDGHYFSPLQIGKMHRALALNNCRRYIEGFPYSNTNLEINTDETWDFDIRLFNNIVVKTGSKLTISCNVYLPPDATITVETGASLIINGGRIYKGNNIYMDGIFQKEENSLTIDAMHGTHPSWADYNNDGSLDLFLPVGKPSASNQTMKNVLYKNNCDDNKFIKMNAVPEGIVSDENLSSQSGIWGDVDNDGDLDLFVLNLNSSGGQYINAKNYFYINNGDGTFTPKPNEVIVANPSVTGGIAWADFNNDGWLDLIVANNKPNLGTAQPSIIYLNSSTGFSSSSILVLGTFDDAGVVAPADIDNDGDMDIYISGGNHSYLLKNKFIGTGTLGFDQITSDPIMATNYVPTNTSIYGALWFDFDNKEGLDLLLTLASFNNPNVNNVLFKNDGTGNFTRVTNSSNELINTPVRCEGGATVGDVDNDGDQDVFTTDLSNENSLFINDGTGIFTKKPYEILSNDKNGGTIESKGAAFADYDKDGDLDLFVSNYFGSTAPNDFFYINKYENKGNLNDWIDISLEGSTSNKSAIGAIVSVTANSITQTQMVTSNYGSGGNSPLNLHFGLGGNETIEAISIKWPGMATEVTYTPPPKNIFYKIIQGTSNFVVVPKCLNNKPIPCWHGLKGIMSGTIKLKGLTCEESTSITMPNIILKATDMTLISRNIFDEIVCDAHSPKTYYVQTDKDGNYSFELPVFGTGGIPGDDEIPYVYKIEPILSSVSNYNIEECLPLFQKDLTINLQEQSGLDFLLSVDNINDIKLSTFPFYLDHNSAPCPSIEQKYCTQIKNNGSTITNGTLTITTDVANTFILANSLPTGWTNSIAQNVFTSSNITLYPNEEEQVCLSTTNNLPMNSAIVTKASFTGTCNSTTITGDALDLIETVACSHDPNDKLLVQPKGCGNENRIKKDEQLIYKIRYENTGAGIAYDVKILDKIDPNLDISTLEIIASSHAVTNLQVDPNNVVSISFDGIQLPYQSIDADNCLGYVVIGIMPKSNLPNGTVIKNQAEIYFDINEAVITNTVINTLYDNPLPTASFTETHSCSGLGLVSYNFTNTGSTDDVTYSWNFGSDATPSASTVANPTGVIFSTSGTKEITLTVNRNGCISEYSESIEVDIDACRCSASCGKSISGSTWWSSDNAGQVICVQEGEVLSSWGTLHDNVTIKNCGTINLSNAWLGSNGVIIENYGNFNYTGDLTMSNVTLKNGSSGTVTVNGRIELVNGSIIENNGVLTANGTTSTAIHGGSHITNKSNGVISITNADLFVDDASGTIILTNEGTINVTASNTKLWLTGGNIINNSGTINVNDFLFESGTLNNSCQINVANNWTQNGSTTVNGPTDSRVGRIDVSGFSNFTWGTFGGANQNIDFCDAGHPTNNWDITGGTVLGNVTYCTRNSSCTPCNLITSVSASDADICNGSLTTLSATGGTTYHWNTVATTQNITVSPITNTTYTVTITGNNCSVTQTIGIGVTVPIADAGEDQSICVGSSASLSATGGDTYNWSTTENTSSITVSPTTTTTYLVTVTNSNNCTVTDNVVVTVNPLPTANAGADATICNGQSTILTATGGTSYVWSNSATTVETTVSPTTTTTYIVTVTSNSCTSTDNVIVTVNPLPTATISMVDLDSHGTPNDQVVCFYNNGISNVSLTANTNHSNCTYVWNFNGATTSSISIETPPVIYNHIVTITDENNCSNTASLEVSGSYAHVNDGPDRVICPGTLVNLPVYGSSSYNIGTNFTYLWNTGQTSNNINVSPVVSTTYTVTGTNEYGCSEAYSIDIYVATPPTVSLPSDYAICQGTQTHITASGANSYLWNTGATGTEISPTPTITTTYSVTGTNFTTGCVASDEIVITVNPIPTANAGADATICTGTSTNLTATGGGTYNWNTTETTSSITVNPTTTTTYLVTITNSNNCTASDNVVVIVNPIPTANAGSDQSICIGASANLSATGGSTYSWNTGANTTSTIVTTYTTTTYTVTATSSGCSSSDAMVVTVNSIPTANAGTDVSINNGSSTTLSATGGSSYAWSSGATTASTTVSPSTTTTFLVTVTNNNCTSTDNVVVTVINYCNFGGYTNPGAGWNNYITNVTISGGGINNTTTGTDGSYYDYTGNTDGAVTKGSSYSSSVTYNKSAWTTYLGVYIDWNNDADFNDANETIVNNATLQSGSGSGTYNFTINVPSGVATSTVRMRVYDNSNAGACAYGYGEAEDYEIAISVGSLLAEAGNNQTICRGSSVNLGGSPTASGGTSPYSYAWSASTGANPSATANPSVTPTVTTTYTLTLTDNNSVTSTDNVVVTVNAIPTANAGNDATYSGTPVTLTAIGGGTYVWSNSATTASISVSPTSTTTYIVTVTSNNCTASDNVIVAVQQTYCNFGGYAYPGAGWSNYITNVSITNGGINNSTTGTDGSYHDYTGNTDGSVTKGSSYSASVTYNKSAWTTYLGVYIDWNNDGDWVDANEIVVNNASLQSGSGSGTYSFTISVPSGAASATVRMRVYDNSSAGACAYAYGEVEDYEIIVSPPLPAPVLAPTQLEETITSVNNEEFNKDVVLVYPNPARSELTIEYHLVGKENLSFRVNDLIGKQVLNLKINDKQEGKIVVPLTDLSAGTYLYQISSNHQIIKIDKLIILK